MKPHGIRGEVAVDVRTDSPEERFAPETVLTGKMRDGRTRPLTVAAVRPHGGRLLVRFLEVPDRTAAEEIRGATLLIDVDELPPIDDPDEFYDHELEGLRAELMTARWSAPRVMCTRPVVSCWPWRSRMEGDARCWYRSYAIVLRVEVD